MKKDSDILKPMSVARSEFLQSLADLINNCMLPPFVIEAALKDVYNEMRVLSQRQLEIDTKKYQEALRGADINNDK